MKTKESPEGWTTPELIVLMRNKPDEAVLDVCKNNINGTGTNSVYATCWWYEKGPAACIECDAQAAS